jgi:hypothetical protein
MVKDMKQASPEAVSLTFRKSRGPIHVFALALLFCIGRHERLQAGKFDAKSDAYPPSKVLNCGARANQSGQTKAASTATSAIATTPVTSIGERS